MDGFEELGTVNQQIAARMFRNPPVEGIHVVHIDPAQIPVNMRRIEPDEVHIVNDWTVGQKPLVAPVIGAMEGQNVSVIREPVVVHRSESVAPLVAPVVGRKAILRNGRITDPLRATENAGTIFTYLASVGEDIMLWCDNGGYYYDSVDNPSNFDIVGLLEEDSHACCDNESRNMNGGCDNCGDPSL